MKYEYHKKIKYWLFHSFQLALFFKKHFSDRDFSGKFISKRGRRP